MINFSCRGHGHTYVNVSIRAEVARLPKVMEQVIGIHPMEQEECRTASARGGPFCGGQPAAIGVPHNPGIAHDAPRHQSP
jgi:hypothetical protein